MSIFLYLKKVNIMTADFENVVKKASENALVYFDPPYPPLDRSSNFTHYTKERFSIEQQGEVASIAQELA